MRTTLDVDGLRLQLARRGMTSAELAAIAGLAEATVSHAMNRHQVSYTTIRKLARALSVTPILPNADTFLLEKNGGAVAGGQPATAPVEVVGVAATNSRL